MAEVRDKESNLRKGINAYNEALNVSTIESYPLDNSMTLNNLGTAYGDLANIKDKEINLEKAINSFQENLNIYTVEKYPLNLCTCPAKPWKCIR